MIARSWHGRVPAARGDEYFDYLTRTGLADYQATPGNLAVLVERWVEDDAAHFLITTLWDSIESIKKFAGEAYQVARYYDEDDDFLLEREPGVHHSDVLYFSSR